MESGKKLVCSCGKQSSLEEVQVMIFSTDTDGEDVGGWHSRCRCGKEILLIND